MNLERRLVAVVVLPVALVAGTPRILGNGICLPGSTAATARCERRTPARGARCRVGVAGTLAQRPPGCDAERGAPETSCRR